jgi:hypothetical protein
MLFHVISTRRLIGMPSNGCAIELEDLLVECCGARLLAPYYSKEPPNLRFDEDVRFEGTSAERMLLVVALWTDLAAVLWALPRWRQDFALVAAYVMDPWGAWNRWPPQVPRDLDCFFVPDVRVAEQYRAQHGVVARAIPMAADVLRFGSNRTGRPLDIVAYGRQAQAYLQPIEEAFNDPRSDRFLYLDTLNGARTRSFRDNRRLIWKLLHKSRCALAFDVLATPDERPGDRYRSIIPLRYYEAAAAGTAIVGVHPVVPEMQAEFAWPEATIDLPHSPKEAVGFLEALLDDGPRLDAIHRRNHLEAWMRHDWRYRIRDMLAMLGLELPPRLAAELAILAGPPASCEHVQWQSGSRLGEQAGQRPCP